MANYYVDKSNGNDADDGGPSDPWDTLQHAIDNTNGGDVIHLANTSAFVLSSEITWGSHGSTTANSITAPLVIKAWDNGGSLTIAHANGQTRVAAVIDGNDAVAGIFSSTSIPSYVIFHDIRMQDCTGDVNAASEWRFVGCEFTNVGGTRMLSAGDPFYCHFHDDGGSGVDAHNSHISIGCFYDNVSGGMSANNADNGPVIGNIFNAMGEATSTGDDEMIYLCNVFNGQGGSDTITGLERVTAENRSIIIGNIFRDYAGTGGVGCAMGANTYIHLWNSYYNCDTDNSGSPFLDGENTEPESSDPLQDPATDDYRVVNGAAAEKVIPALPGVSANINLWNAGAVQNDPDAGGGGSTEYVPLPARRQQRVSSGVWHKSLRHVVLASTAIESAVVCIQRKARTSRQFYPHQKRRPFAAPGTDLSASVFIPSRRRTRPTIVPYPQKRQRVASAPITAVNQTVIVQSSRKVR